MRELSALILKDHNYNQIKDSITQSVKKLQKNYFDKTSILIRNNIVDKNFINESLKILNNLIYTKKMVPDYNEIITEANKILKDKRSNNP